MKKILYLGNTLNQGTARGKSVSFLYLWQFHSHYWLLDVLTEGANIYLLTVNGLLDSVRSYLV